MSLAFDRSLTGLCGPPAQPTEESKLNIVVVFTSAAATSAALKKAGALAESLNARITLIVPQIVPYPLPLTSPPVLLDFRKIDFATLRHKRP